MSHLRLFQTWRFISYFARLSLSDLRMEIPSTTLKYHLTCVETVITLKKGRAEMKDFVCVYICKCVILCYQEAHTVFSWSPLQRPIYVFYPVPLTAVPLSRTPHLRRHLWCFMVAREFMSFRTGYLLLYSWKIYLRRPVEYFLNRRFSVVIHAEWNTFEDRK